jgi:hypothetical protein
LSFFARHAFGVAGDGVDPRVVGDIVFSSPLLGAQWATAGQMYSLDPSFYTVPSKDVVAAAQLQWEKLENHIALNTPSAARAQDRLLRLRSSLGAPIMLVNTLAGSNNYRLTASALSNITSIITAFGKESWPDPQEELEAADAAAQAAADAKVAADAKAAADRAQAEANAKKTQASIDAARAAIAAAEAAKAAAQHSGAVASQKRATAGGASLLSPLLFAAVGVPLLALVAVFAHKSRKSSVGRYRRRRR